MMQPSRKSSCVIPGDVISRELRTRWRMEFLYFVDNVENRTPVMSDAFT